MAQVRSSQTGLPNQFAGRPISYTEVDEDEWISGLEKGSYDAAIVSDLVNSGKWYIRPFYKEYLALIVSAQQPITKSNPPDLTLLKGQTIIINERLFNTYDKFLKRMAKRGLTFSKVIRTFSPFTAMHQCAQDIGVCFLGGTCTFVAAFSEYKGTVSPTIQRCL